jgi:hypothetical protein
VLHTPLPAASVIGIRSGISSGFGPEDTDLLNTTRVCFQKFPIGVQPWRFSRSEYQHGSLLFSIARNLWSKKSGCLVVGLREPIDELVIFFEEAGSPPREALAGAVKDFLILPAQ